MQEVAIPPLSRGLNRPEVDLVLVERGFLHTSTSQAAPTTVVFTLERALHLDANLICMRPGQSSEPGQTERRKVRCPHLLIELLWGEVDNVFVGRGSIPTPQQVKLRQHLVREGCLWHKHHLRGIEASGETQIEQLI